jgi:hypothetical protein
MPWRRRSKKTWLHPPWSPVQQLGFLRMFIPPKISYFIGYFMGFGPSSFVSPCNRWRRWPCQFIMRWPKSSVRTKNSPSLSGHSLLWRSPDSLAAKQKNGDRGQTSHTTDMSWHVTTCHNQKVDLFFRPQNVLSHPVTSSCLVSAPTINKWVSNPLNHGSGLFQRRIHLPMKICSTINVAFYTNSGTPEKWWFFRKLGCRYPGFSMNKVLNWRIIWGPKWNQVK